jgi:hypothetical protein
MSFYKQILPFIDYIHSIRKLKNYLSFDMVFPTKWSLPKSLVEEGQIVGFETDTAETKGISFVAEISDASTNEILRKIANVIKLNKEKELKEKLFRQTVEQLKQTFEKTDLERLQNLYFDFDINEETNLDIHEPSETESENDKLVGEREEKGPKRTRTSKKSPSPTNEED